MFVPQPITIVSEDIFGFPSALTVLFRENESMLNVHPNKIMFRYSSH